ncbi:protein mono-ADP-ribosyltransferase PARP12-like [Saccostrea cucullata]|uniref:protein mono-ADP-ribosyltransferase PARP12-like n=1 Tax=Saccostrea cuccullata TaxID=36930 RepID=UPI002ED1C9F4
MPKRGTPKYVEYMFRNPPRSPPYWTKYTNKCCLKDWAEPTCYEVDVDKKTFGCIENAFLKTMGGKNCKIEKICRLENANLYFQYAHERVRQFRKVHMEGIFTPLERLLDSNLVLMQALGFLKDDLHSEVNEYYFFHGTATDCLENIKIQGLVPKLPKAHGGLLGNGIYGAEMASKSDGYTGTNDNVRAMLLLRMCLGDVFITRSQGKFFRPPCRKCNDLFCKKHQELYDSVVAETGGYFRDREFVVYEKNQVYPEYLILYK